MEAFPRANEIPDPALHPGRASLSACSPSGDLLPPAVQRDSAGIGIVKPFAPALGRIRCAGGFGVEPLLDLTDIGVGRRFLGVWTDEMDAERMDAERAEGAALEPQTERKGV